MIGIVPGDNVVANVLNRVKRTFKSRHLETRRKREAVIAWRERRAAPMSRGYESARAGDPGLNE